MYFFFKPWLYFLPSSPHKYRYRTKVWQENQVTVLAKIMYFFFLCACFITISLITLYCFHIGNIIVFNILRGCENTFYINQLLQNKLQKDINSGLTCIPPKLCPHPNPRNLLEGPLFGKRVFADIIKFMISR